MKFMYQVSSAIGWLSLNQPLCNGRRKTVWVTIGPAWYSKSV